MKAVVGKIEWYDGNEWKRIGNIVEEREQEELPEHMEGELSITFSMEATFQKPLQTRMMFMAMYAEKYAKIFKN